MTRLVASLGMYDAPAVRGANDRLWAAIANRLRAAGIGGVPDCLDRDRPLEAIWDDPGLLLAQTCGYPFVTRWRGRLRYVATPRYRVAGCEGVRHASRVVVRADDPVETLAACRGRRLALNDRHSNSGMNLLRALVAPLAGGRPFFGAVIESGAHAESARLVVRGEADLAAIDNVTFAVLERDEPEVTRALRTLAWTPAAPNLPFVTAAATPRATVSALRRAIGAAIAQEARRDADLLFLDGVEVIDPRRYDVLLAMERRAAKLGYPELA